MNFLEEISHIYTNVTKEELKTLHSLVQSNKNDLCVEIGSYFGASSYAIASALKDNSRLYCIDIWKSNTAMRPDPKDGSSLLDSFKKNTKKHEDKIITIVDYSYNAYKIFKNNNSKIDFLFIDGDHSYEGVKKDFDLYLPLMNKGGIIAFHDWGWGSVKKMIMKNVLDKTIEHKSLPNMWWAKVK